MRLIWLLLLLSLPIHAASEGLDSLLTATPEHCGVRDSTALRHCRAFVQGNPANHAARWRIAYFAATLANREANQDKRERYLQEASQQARWLVTHKPQAVDGWFVMALVEGVEAQHSGARRRVELARSIRSNLNRGLAIDSTHPGLQYLSGRWNFALANLTRMEKALVNLLLGGVPKGASNEAALRALQAAVAARPNEKLFKLDLVRTLQALGRREQARAECQKALALPLRNDEDPLTQAKLQKLLKDL